MRNQKHNQNMSNPTKDIFINDSCFVVPYHSEDERMKMVKDLEEKKKNGHGISRIECDERSESVIYSQRQQKASSFH